MFQLIAKGKSVVYSLCTGTLEQLDEIVTKRDGIVWLGGECCQLDIV